MESQQRSSGDLRRRRLASPEAGAEGISSILLKKVELLNCEAALPSLQLFPNAMDAALKRVCDRREAPASDWRPREAFLGEGYEVISIARRPCPLRSAAPALDLGRSHGCRSDPRGGVALAAEAPATTIVHCAGAIREKPIEETSIADLAALANLHFGARPCRWCRPTCRR